MPTKTQTKKTKKVSEKSIQKKKPANQKQSKTSEHKVQITKPQPDTRNIVTKIINLFVYVFGGILLCIYLIIFIMEIAQSMGKPIFGYQFYYLASGSMEPTLHIGDKILVKATDNFEIGDVITFTEDGGQNYTTHRVVSINDDIVVTKGDANTGNDDPIHLSNIMGKMIKKADFVKFILDIKYPLIALFAAIILVSLFLKKE